MKVLLDSSLLSELLRAHSDDWITHWVDAFSEDEIYLSALTIGELVHSIEAESLPELKANMYRWLEDDLLVRFHGKVIPLDLDILTEWGKISAEADAQQKPLSALDGMIAATARARALVLITFNRDAFSELGVEVSDPWQG